MLDATGVNVDLEPRIFTHQCAGGGRVVEMNVREEDSVEVSDSDAVNFELLTKFVESRSRTGID